MSNKNWHIPNWIEDVGVAYSVVVYEMAILRTSLTMDGCFIRPYSNYGKSQLLFRATAVRFTVASVKSVLVFPPFFGYTQYDLLE